MFFLNTMKYRVFVIKSSLVVKVIKKIYKNCKPYDNYQKDKRKKAYVKDF
ncbi:hypothetical protein STRIC_0179 [Streptococcus ictaluri 707-05]|uniref:Uncharacterized protein n=1 Tax=Streptococcus ictaluri 707-05 TaxID=764299 RepID=G5K0Q3_9STRE|nr:hypothetical protein STRIC_0179 [Streptococcus ictaluri 707-05]